MLSFTILIQSMVKPWQISVELFESVIVGLVDFLKMQMSWFWAENILTHPLLLKTDSEFLIVLKAFSIFGVYFGINRIMPPFMLPKCLREYSNRQRWWPHVTHNLMDVHSFLCGAVGVVLCRSSDVAIVVLLLLVLFLVSVYC